jgi:hypothetical protein
MSMHITKERQRSRLVLALTVVLIGLCSARAGEPDPRYIAKAQSFLEDEKRAKATLNMAHFGATFRGVDTLSCTRVVDDKNRELEGYFALTVRYFWAGLLSSDEHTDMVFFFDDRGRYYAIKAGETTGLLKPFDLSNAVIELYKDLILAMVRDADQDTKDGVERAIRDKDAKTLLHFKLRLEQP